MVREPANTPVADLLRTDSDALLTRDLVDALHLEVGDTFLVGGGNTATVRFTLAGIVGATPNQQGKTVYFLLEGARRLEARPDMINTVALLWDTPRDEIIATDYLIFIAQEHNGDSSVNLFDLMLKGAGVLGLLIGGIGVSNTMQVMLARRKLEIAMLKTVGYRRGHLLLLIGLETALIGLTGGLIGTVLGMLIAERLTELLGSSGSLMMNWTPNALIVGGSVFAGTVTAGIFGLQTILASSATRPVQLLRELPLSTPVTVRVVRSGLYGLLFTLYGLLVGLITGSLLEGLAMVYGGAVLLLVLRGLFWLLLWAVLKMPSPRYYALRLSVNSLNRRKAASTLPLIALFAGTFAVAFAVMVIYNIQERLMAERGSDEGFNLMVYTDADGVEAAVGAIVTQGVTTVYSRYLLNAALPHPDGNVEALTLEGRTPQDLAVGIQIASGGLQGENTVMVDENRRLLYNYQLGDNLTVTTVNGEEHTLTISGFYSPHYMPNIAGNPDGLIVSWEIAMALGTVQAQVIAEFPITRLRGAADALGPMLPDALIFSLADINDLHTGSLRGFGGRIGVCGRCGPDCQCHRASAGRTAARDRGVQSGGLHEPPRFERPAHRVQSAGFDCRADWGDWSMDCHHTD
jgi:putative ABC transport system permease protein